jgi:hypothetical protein
MARNAMHAVHLRRSRSLALIALVLVVAAALVAAGGHVLHVHVANNAGLYNEQHVLEGAAGLSPDAPVPSAPGASVAASAAAAPPPALQPVAPAPAVRRADPRAPPSA